MNTKNVSCSVIAFLLLTVGTSCSPVNVKHQASPPPSKNAHNFLMPLKALPQLPVSDYPYIVFSPDNRTLGISTEEKRPDYGTLRLWNLQTGKRILRELSQDDVETFCFSPDGQYIATELREELSTDKSKMQLWDIRSEKLIWSKSINDSEQLIQFSPDGNYIVSAYSSVFIWQVSTGKVLHNLYLHPEYVDAIKFSPKGDLLAVDLGERILLLDTKTWRIDPRNRLKGGVDLTRNLAFSPDGKLLAVSVSYSEAGTSSLWVWNVKKRKLLRSFISYEDEVPDASYPLNFTQDGMSVVIDLYTLDINKRHSKFQPLIDKTLQYHGEIRRLSLSVRSMLALVIITKSDKPNEARMEIWDIKHHVRKQSWPIIDSDYDGEQGFFSPDGTLLATTYESENNKAAIRLWQVN